MRCSLYTEPLSSLGPNTALHGQQETDSCGCGESKLHAFFLYSKQFLFFEWFFFFMNECCFKSNSVTSPLSGQNSQSLKAPRRRDQGWRSHTGIHHNHFWSPCGVISLKSYKELQIIYNIWASKITPTALLSWSCVSSGSCGPQMCQHPVTQKTDNVKFAQSFV